MSPPKFRRFAGLADARLTPMGNEASGLLSRLTGHCLFRSVQIVGAAPQILRFKRGNFPQKKLPEDFAQRNRKPNRKTALSVDGQETWRRPRPQAPVDQTQQLSGHPRKV